MEKFSSRLGLISVVAMLISCSSDVREICQGPVLSFRKSLDAQLTVRNLASDSLTGLEKNEQLRQWEDWSQDWLIRVQDTIDEVHGMQEVGGHKRELAMAANHLVALYGYSTSRKYSKALEKLREIQEQVQKFEKKVCHR